MKQIERIIKDYNLEIEEYKKLKEIFSNNIGKKLTKKHLGRTPVITYSDNISSRFKTYIEIETSPYRNSGYIEFHDPVIQLDIENIDKHIGWKIDSIATLQNLINNKSSVIEQRNNLIELQKTFEAALHSFMDSTGTLKDHSELYKEYFGIDRLERTYFQREY